MARFTLEVLDDILARCDPVPTVAIETGTWRGDTTALLAQRFAQVATIDIDPAHCAAAHQRFAGDEHVDILWGDSGQQLRCVLGWWNDPIMGAGDRIATIGHPGRYWRANVLLYLDAHWWAGHGGYADKSPFPLWAELETAKACPWVRVVVVDDVYQMGAYNDANPGWHDATPDRILAALGGRVDRHAIIGDQLVAWLNGGENDNHG